jgi:hypothetical protein
MAFICVERVCIPLSEMGGGGNGAVDLLVSRCKTCCDSVVSTLALECRLTRDILHRSGWCCGNACLSSTMLKTAHVFPGRFVKSE